MSMTAQAARTQLTLHDSADWPRPLDYDVDGDVSEWAALFLANRPRSLYYRNGGKMGEFVNRRWRTLWAYHIIEELSAAERRTV